jgi:VWFA-related protein
MHNGSDPIVTPRIIPGVIAVMLVAVCLAIGAQSQQPPIFRGGINIVQTDVTVLGPDGRPFHGLTIDDFELFEDGERLPILGFAEVNLPDADEAPPWMREAGTDVRSALQGRVLLFLLDDAQVPYMMRPGAGFIHPDERKAAVKRIAEQFINRMGPDDVAAVICTYDNRCDQDFTSDRARIRAAVARFVPKTIQAGASGYKVSANMAMSIAKYLEGQNSRRRTIVYVSPRLPTRPAVWPPLNNDMSLDDIQVLATFQAAMRAGITVYGVNPTSLLSLKDAPPDDPDEPESDRTVLFATPPRSLATETGGFIVARPSEFADGVAQIFRETGSYYLLGYEPPPKKDTGYNMIGGLRSLEVRVKVPNLTIKTHRGYITVPPPKPARNPPAESSAALAGVLPKTDLPLRVSAAPFAVPGQSEALVSVTVGVTEPAGDTRSLDRLDLQIRAFTPHGDQRAMMRTQVDARLPRTRGDAELVDVVAELRLKPGTYELRVGASSARLGTAGSVYTDVVVPDFAAAPLSISGVLLMSMPRPELASPAALPALLPVTPTTSREFGRTAIVRAHLRVYQGGKAPVVPIAVESTIVDGKNAIALNLSETLDVGRFVRDRSADLRIDVPVSELQPGPHRLRVEARKGAVSVSRDVIFRVK